MAASAIHLIDKCLLISRGRLKTLPESLIMKSYSHANMLLRTMVGGLLGDGRPLLILSVQMNANIHRKSPGTFSRPPLQLAVQARVR